MKNVFSNRLTFFLKKEGVYEEVLYLRYTHPVNSQTRKDETNIDTVNCFDWNIKDKWYQLYERYEDMKLSETPMEGMTLYDLL